MTTCPGCVFRAFSLDGLSRPCVSNVYLDDLSRPCLWSIFIGRVVPAVFEHCPGRGCRTFSLDNLSWSCSSGIFRWATFPGRGYRASTCPGRGCRAYSLGDSAQAVFVECLHRATCLGRVRVERLYRRTCAGRVLSRVFVRPGGVCVLGVATKEEWLVGVRERQKTQGFHGARVGSGAFQKVAGRVGSGQEMFEISPVGLGRIRRLSSSTGRVG